jgi:polyphosphate glucokinase
MKVLTIDIGGTHVKFRLTGKRLRREFPTGSKLTPKVMIAEVKKLTEDWPYDAVSIGYPGPVLNNQPTAEPHNLAKGWVKFDFKAAFACPVQLINDAALQALGSYEGGKLLFLGLGTGLGSTMVVDGIIEPMELGHLPYKKGTYEDYVGLRGLEKRGKKKWRKDVAEVVGLLIAALEPEDVVLGGGNVKQLKVLPEGTRAGDNSHAFLGGDRLWAAHRTGSIPPQVATAQKTSSTPAAKTAPKAPSKPAPKPVPKPAPKAAPKALVKKPTPSNPHSK